MRADFRESSEFLCWRGKGADAAGKDNLAEDFAASGYPLAGGVYENMNMHEDPFQRSICTQVSKQAFNWFYQFADTGTWDREELGLSEARRLPAASVDLSP